MCSCKGKQSIIQDPIPDGGLKAPHSCPPLPAHFLYAGNLLIYNPSFLDRSINNIEIFISIGIELPSYNLCEYFSMERIPSMQDNQIVYVMPDFLPGACHRRSAANLCPGEDPLLPRNHSVTWFAACIVCFVTGNQVN